MIYDLNEKGKRREDKPRQEIEIKVETERQLIENGLKTRRQWIHDSTQKKKCQYLKQKSVKSKTIVVHKRELFDSRLDTQ